MTKIPVTTDKAETLDSVRAERDAFAKQAYEAQSTLDEARKAWNTWLFIEKECEDGHAHMSFPKDAVAKLLYLLGK